VNTVMNLQAPYIAGKFLSSCTIGGVSKRAHEFALVSYWNLLLISENFHLCLLK
jgi:hypothetical protein